MVWGCTDTKLYEFEYKWTITNLSLHMEHAEDVKDVVTLESPMFSAEDINDSKWHLELLLHCSTHISKDHIGIGIVFDGASTETKVRASQTYFFVTNAGARYQTLRMSLHEFKTALDKWSKNQVYRKKKLLKEADIYLPNDQLTIICQIKVMGNPNECGVDYHIPKVSTETILLEDLGNLLLNEKLSDVTFLLGSEEFRAHKNILMARSPVFNAMFEHDMRETYDNIVKVDDIEPEIFKHLLYYIYTSKVRDIDNIAMDLLPAADKYGLERLKAMCGQSIYKRITINNAIETLIFADRHSDLELIKCTENFINTHMMDVMETSSYAHFEKNYPVLAMMLFKRITMATKRRKINNCEEKC